MSRTALPRPPRRSRLRVTASLLVGLVAVGVVLAAPASAASPTACRVRNLDSGVTKPSLQKAVTAARSGQRLTVRGTCKGPATLGKSLSIKGVRTTTSGTPTLDGDLRGTVVTVKAGAKVTINRLTIRGGGVPSSATGVAGAIDLQGDGGGIFNAGVLILTNVVVRDNTANQGAGAWNHGKLTLLGSTAIRGNTAHFGGGIYNYALSGTGYKGALTMKDKSSVRSNTAVDSISLDEGSGGGVFNDGAKITMAGSSSIRTNSATAGGGIYNSSANQPVTLSGVVCGPGGNVRDNTAAAGGDDCAPA